MKAIEAKFNTMIALCVHIITKYVKISNINSWTIDLIVKTIAGLFYGVKFQ